MSHVIARSSLLSTVVGALVISAACSRAETPPPPAATPAPVIKTAAQRVQLYQACWDHFNNKQWDQFRNCYADNAVSESVDSAVPVTTGRDAIIERAKTEAEPFPDRRGEIRIVLVNGDRVASLALLTASHTGPLPPAADGKPVPPTNKSIGMLLAHTLEMDPTGSHAVREATYVDEGSLAAQLGLSPAPARKAEKPTAAAPVVVMAKNDDLERKNIEVVRRSFAALNAHDAKGVAATLAPGYRAMDIARPADMDAKAADAALKELFSSFPDVKATPVTMWAAGDYVVVTGTFEGTNLGDIPSMGLKKTGRKVSAHFFELFRLENGLCKEDWLFYNSQAMASQLGQK